jgi:hypothetical protein
MQPALTAASQLPMCLFLSAYKERSFCLGVAYYSSSRQAADVLSEVTISMKLALIFFSVLTSFSLWFGAQGTPPVICRGKPLSITLLPGSKMTGPSLPLRFGGTREFPRLKFPSDKALRLVIKNRDELFISFGLSLILIRD